MMYSLHAIIRECKGCTLGRRTASGWETSTTTRETTETTLTATSA
jgi:hypothetical protein